MLDTERPRRGRRWLLAPALAACLGAVMFGLPAGRPAAANAAGSSGPAGPAAAAGCPASNPPNALTLVSGTPQTAQLDSQFASTLQVQLANTDGCAVTSVAGTPITFSAPPSGASGTFATSGSSSVTVGADGSGSASAPGFSADDTAGGYTVTATSAYGSVSFSLTNTAAGIPAQITPLAPSGQSARAGARYAHPLAVRVLDAGGAPVVAAAVTFSLGSPGGAGAAGAGAAAGASFAGGSSQATEQTNSDGIATSPELTADATPGAFTATASVAHVTQPASFSLRNLAAGSLTVRPASSTHESAAVDTRYRRRLRVRVLDAAGRPAQGQTVTFGLGGGGLGGSGSGSGAAARFLGGSSTASETTGARGYATSPPISADATAGTIAATATVSGARRPAQFWLRNRAGEPSRISVGVAAGESTPVRTRFQIPLAVSVTDSHGNPVPRARVTFTAPASGPSGSFGGRGGRRVSVRTGSSGVAVAPRFIANGVVGGYVVIATAGRARAVGFALVNQPAGTL